MVASQYCDSEKAFGWCGAHLRHSAAILVLLHPTTQRKFATLSSVMVKLTHVARSDWQVVLLENPVRGTRVLFAPVSARVQGDGVKNDTVS
jgi:hypothetical protein